jgi:hypothetical protein
MYSFKRLLSIWVAKSVRSRWIYGGFWHPLSRLCHIAEREHKWCSLAPRVSQAEALKQICPDLVVRHGPFKGLKYPGEQALCSTLVPKLLGSYERELHPIWEGILQRGYVNVLDIGCAEGYYAVGLALALPEARVWAFDANPDALRLCRAMAELNGVAERVQLKGGCSEALLRTMPLSGRTLVLSDCEGYERQLFTPAVCRHLTAHDVLIEAHDFKDFTLSQLLQERFRESHTVEIISSVQDACRPQIYSYAELARFDRDTQISLLAELRPTQMEWLFFQSRQPWTNGSARVAEREAQAAGFGSAARAAR